MSWDLTAVWTKISLWIVISTLYWKLEVIIPFFELSLVEYLRLSVVRGVSETWSMRKSPKPSKEQKWPILAKSMAIRQEVPLHCYHGGKRIACWIPSRERLLRDVKTATIHVTHCNCCAREKSISHGSDFLHWSTVRFHNPRVCLRHKVEWV